MSEEKENQNVQIFPYGNRMITLVMPSLEEIEYNIDDITNIDYSNILAEVLTFPVIMNRLGLLLAEADRLIRVGNLNIQLEKDNLTETKSKCEVEAFKELKKTINAPTKDQISAEVQQNQIYKDAVTKLRDLEYELINTQKQRDEINSIYWSAKSKDEKLNVIVKTLRPEEFEKEIVEGSINGILVRNTAKIFG